jgi:hypothetical protein
MSWATQTMTADRVVPTLSVTREEPIVCHPKPLQPDGAELLKQGQTVLGWIHAVHSRTVVYCLPAGGRSTVAREDMCDRCRHVF